MSGRVVEASECRVRHIVQCADTDPGAVPVLGVHFCADDERGVGGRAGWQAATVEDRLTEEGKVIVRFPNTAGGDGRLHRDRFAIVTRGDDYRIGDEWLEVWREGHRLMAVATPTTYDLDGTTLTLECFDGLALTVLAREEAANPWCAAPRDVLEHYGSLEVAHTATDFRAWPHTGDGAADGWTYTGAVPVAGAAGITGTLERDAAGLTEHWTAAVLFRVIAPRTSGAADATITTPGGHVITLDTAAGKITADGEAGSRAVGPSAAVILRVYRRGRYVWVQLNGETLAELPAADAGDTFTIAAGAGATLAVQQATLSTVRPWIAAADEPGDLHVPGAPTPGGLWGAYYREEGLRAKLTAAAFRQRAPAPFSEPYQERLDAGLNFAAASPAAWRPAGSADGAWAARWTGAVYLDLESADRELRLINGAGDQTRLWVGRTTGAPYVTATAGTVTGPPLRAHLGQQASGWYPVVIEHGNADGAGGIILSDALVGGAHAAIPADRLSPYGVFIGTIQRESHREVIRQVTDAFAYQWRVEPRSLESGAFPGRLVPRLRVGQDRDVTITEDAPGVQVRGSAADSVDRLLIDAAGLARPDGAEQLAVEAWDTSRAGGLFLATGYEQASEVTEERLMEQRALSLLALRSGINQQIEVQPSGERRLVDTWPLTGELSRMEWLAGDGVRLALAHVGVVDLEPRQLLGITWPCLPDGVGVPQATWRQRPVGARALLLRALRAAQAPQRTYQGQIVEHVGTLGGSAGEGAADTYSRLAVAPERIVRLVARIPKLDGAGVLEVNGTAALTLPGPGEYDVTGFMAYGTSATTAARQYARVTGATAYTVQLAAELSR